MGRGVCGGFPGSCVREHGIYMFGFVLAGMCDAKGKTVKKTKRTESATFILLTESEGAD